MPSYPDPFEIAARKYKAFPGDAARVYRALCYILSDRTDQVPWDAFTDDDWALFPPMAETEGVAPLMYWKLKDHSEIRNSKFEIQDRLSSLINKLSLSYYQTLAQNTLLYQELERILAAFDEAGIEAIVLKGAALAVKVYEDIGLRPMGDLDLLVKKEFLKSAIKQVQTLDYQKAGHPDLSSWQKKITGFHEGFFSNSLDSVVVELHWNLIAGDYSWLSPPLDWFWGQANTWCFPLTFKEKLQGSDRRQLFQGLSPIANLLHLAAHLMLRHGEAEGLLVWYYDLHCLIGMYQDTLDWEKLPAIARRFKWSPAVSAAFKGSQLRFVTPFADESMKTLDRKSKKRVVNLVQKKALLSQTRSFRGWNKLTSLSWRGRVYWIFALIFPGQDFIQWRYKPHPMWLWPFYYPYRWADIFVDTLRTLLRISRQSSV